MTRLTYQQKLDALSYRFYQSGQWTPKAGDYYTTSRADLELYQVVSVEDGIVRTRFTEGSDAIAEWPEDGFLTDGFGPKRVFVPPWVMDAQTPPPQSKTTGEPTEVEKLRSALQAAVDTIRDYLAYEHDGDPWSEDSRTMGEMDINDYATDGRLDYALSLLTPQNEEGKEGKEP